MKAESWHCPQVFIVETGLPDDRTLVASLSRRAYVGCIVLPVGGSGGGGFTRSCTSGGGISPPPGGITSPPSSSVFVEAIDVSTPATMNVDANSATTPSIMTARRRFIRRSRRWSDCQRCPSDRRRIRGRSSRGVRSPSGRPCIGGPRQPERPDARAARTCRCVRIRTRR